MKTNNRADIAKLLKRHTPEIKKMTTTLAGLARRLTPGATEKIYMGWHCVMFQYGGMKNLACIVAPQTKHVNVFLIRHPSVDPKKRMEGTSKAMGHLKIRFLAEAKKPEIARMIKASAKLATSNR